MMPVATTPRDKLMAFPSLSNGLHSLPQATSLHDLPLHANFTATLQHTAESAAKLQKALQVNAARSQPSSTPGSSLSTTPTQTDPSQITIRKKAKFSV